MEKPCSWSLIILAQLFFIRHCSAIPNNYTRDNFSNDDNYETASASSSSLKLQVLHREVIMSNSRVSVTFSKPDGDVIAIKYGHVDNILEPHNHLHDRGYWDVVYGGGGEESMFYQSETMNDEFSEESMFYEELRKVPIDSLRGTSFKIIVQNEEQIEISFSRIWNWRGGAPLNIDKRFIMRRESSGFYAYGILERQSNFPASRIDQIRIVFRLRESLFDYMAISDKIQKVMPSRREREAGRILDYPEAVRLKNGQVDDKYEYSTNNEDNMLHGWISRKERIGFWIITASNEFRNGGPLKQDLTSHCGPLALSMFVSTHYAGRPLAMYFKDKEPWKKVFGPVFIYLNSNTQTHLMWEDAKAQKFREIKSWPYNFVVSPDFPHSNQRATITGSLFVRDGSKTLQGSNAYVGLAAPGNIGSWQYESKGYQFWTRADGEGRFIIKNVRPGNYNLFAWVPGFIGDYKYSRLLTISKGSNTISLGNVVYWPPRTGRTLWEIGYPDRTAAEFSIPITNSYYTNYLFNAFDKFRQYGIWHRYSEIYPRQDLVYYVGHSNYAKDWFYAQVTRNRRKNVYEGTTWQISFELKNVKKLGNYTLQLAIAGAIESELQVRVNNYGDRPLFTTGLFGTENVIARHGIHGLYRLYSVSIWRGGLRMGKNVIYLTQSRGGTPFKGIMYDYIRLEA